jgi:uncharacterized protein YpbB
LRQRLQNHRVVALTTTQIRKVVKIKTETEINQKLENVVAYAHQVNPSETYNIKNRVMKTLTLLPMRKKKNTNFSSNFQMQDFLSLSENKATI